MGTVSDRVAQFITQVEELLKPEALAKFTDVRRQVVESVGLLWLDLHALKMHMRAVACQAFVHGMASVTEQVCG